MSLTLPNLQFESSTAQREGIKLSGVRTHNLRHLDLTIPYRAITVITGVSGSGKSSLAFDTLYAEGQRRFVESLSSYARQFLERMEKPDLDAIEGILPSIAIEAKNVVTNARSTVGTQTEVSDYLRMLFARIGRTSCPKCQREAQSADPQSVARELFSRHKGESISISFHSMLVEKNAEMARNLIEEYERQGFVHFKINGTKVDVSKDELPKDASSVQVEVDLIDIDEQNKARLIESLETAFRYGKGVIEIEVGKKKLRYSNRFSCASCGMEFREPSPNLFSFNSPLGACSVCQGFGRVITIDWNLVIPDPKKTLSEGAIEPWTKPSASWELRQLKAYCKKKKIPLNKPFCELSEKDRDIIIKGDQENEYFGVEDFFRYLEKKTYKMHVRIFLSKYRGFQMCDACSGTRLRPEALCVRLNGCTIADLNRMTIGDLRIFFEKLTLTDYDHEIAEPILIEVARRIRFLDEVGLGYLSLDRASRTLSGGEAQRINLATSLGSALVDTLYVLDEPSIGLHERDNALLIRLLRELRDLGNTIVVVEHDRAMIEAADNVIDMGPLGGERGGEMIYSGPFDLMKNAQRSLTAKYFSGELTIDRDVLDVLNTSGPAVEIRRAKCHNLKSISTKIPLGKLVVITGVSGSGKSTLLYEILYANYLRYRGRPVSDVGTVESIEGFSHISDVVLIDQSPIGRTPRSNPATYIKVFDDIRRAFSQTREARAKRLEPGYFSFNVEGGRCERCEGAGSLKVEMHFLADVFITCENCNGTRYKSAALDIRYREKNIHEVLQLTVDEAIRHFEGEGQISEKLSLLTKLGLGYLRLGQSAVTLSGGEAERLKIISEVHQPNAQRMLYLFDEPTTGLHYRDISLLLNAFDEMLKKGHSICLIEHNMEVIKCADYVIDLGPEGGAQGGEVIYEGSVSGLMACSKSHTGQYLKRYLASKS